MNFQNSNEQRSQMLPEKKKNRLHVKDQESEWQETSQQQHQNLEVSGELSHLHHQILNKNNY